MHVYLSISRLRVIAALAATTVAFAPAAAHAAFEPVSGPVVMVDGDTIAVGRERIRLLDIDTPETFRSRCDNELVLGLKARHTLR